MLVFSPPSKSVPGAAVWETVDHVTQLSESKVLQGVSILERKNTQDLSK